MFVNKFKEGDIVINKLYDTKWLIVGWPSNNDIILHRLDRPGLSFVDSYVYQSIIDLDVLYEHYDSLSEQEKRLWEFFNE